jgi:hypothetical protein
MSHFMPLEVVDASEFVARYKRTVVDGQKWGDWSLDTGNWTLTFRDGTRDEYWINLREIHDSASMLDWIFQVRVKQWATSEIVGDLASAFEDVFNPQANLCSGGFNKEINSEQFLAKLAQRI